MVQAPSILIISSEFPPGPGGLGSHAYHMARELHRRGWRIRVITTQDYAEESAIGKFSNSQEFRIWRAVSQKGPLRGFASRWRLVREQILADRPNILIGTGHRSVWVASLASRVYRIPLVAIGHGSEFGAQNWFGTKLNYWAYKRSSAIICVSEFTRRFMNASGIKTAREYVVPNGADEKRFGIIPKAEALEVRKRLVADAAHILITVGALTERKGQEVVIRAMAKVLESHPGTHYVMAGWPHEAARLKAVSEQMNVTRHVHFMGCVSDEEVPKLINASDVFVMTSRTTANGDCEGYGIAIVEAALCGKPSVVSANSGPAEAILNGKTGLAVPEGDVEATAKAICSLLHDTDYREQLGREARARALQEQTWDRRFAIYDEILREAIA